VIEKIAIIVKDIVTIISCERSDALNYRVGSIAKYIVNLIGLRHESRGGGCRPCRCIQSQTVSPPLLQLAYFGALKLYTYQRSMETYYTLKQLAVIHIIGVRRSSLRIKAIKCLF
jgi:hypothetical protein